MAVDDFVRLPADGGGKALRTNKRTLTIDGTPTVVHEQYVDVLAYDNSGEPTPLGVGAKPLEATGGALWVMGLGSEWYISAEGTNATVTATKTIAGGSTLYLAGFVLDFSTAPTSRVQWRLLKGTGNIQQHRGWVTVDRQIQFNPPLLVGAVQLAVELGAGGVGTTGSVLIYGYTVPDAAI